MRGDQISRTAQQVRARGSDTVHVLFGAWTTPEGRLYRACCGTELGAGRKAALLTTLPVTCGRCAKAGWS